MLKSRIKYRLIVFGGPVGSGKSTQMRYLLIVLRKMNVKSRSTFLKSGHLLAYVLELLLARIVSKRRDVSPIRTLFEDALQLFRRVFKLWLLLDLLSITMKFLLDIYIPSKLGYTILVEEYIPATIADHLYLSSIAGYSKTKINSFSTRYLLRLANLCRPIYVVYLDAENSELYRRWKMRGSVEERRDYLLMQRTILLKLYRRLADTFTYADTGLKSPKEVFSLVTKTVLKSAH